MVRRKEETPYESKPTPFRGLGEITARSLSNRGEDMYGEGRVSACTIVNQGVGTGYHTHENESETCYILSGVGRFNDNGVIRTVTTGNIIFIGAGEGHAIENTGNVPLEMITLILYQ